MNKQQKLILKEIDKKKLSNSELEAIIDQIKNPNLIVNKYKHLWGSRHLRIGLGGDTHIGSKYTRYEVLDDIFKRFKKEKVDAIYLTGDITEGYNMRPGHSFECNLHGADAQIQGVIEQIPDINKPIYFITGDHDYSHYKSQGVDVGIHIEKGRNDMHYLGMFNADIELAKNTTIRLSHPAKGTAYALSYYPQKMIESLSGGEKPEILAIGHYHKIEYLFYRNIHTFQTGCFAPQVGIQTKKGIKKIFNIKVGDEVLTHLNRYRKVTKTFKRSYSGKWIRVSFGRKNHMGNQIVATKEHPLLVERNKKVSFISIANIKEGDILFIKPSACKNCGEKIPFYNKFCNKCNPSMIDAKYNRISQKMNKESPQHKHFYNDILPFCEKARKEGRTIFPIGHIIPDAIEINNNGEIILHELENSRRPNKNKYDVCPQLNSFYSRVEWHILQKLKGNTQQNWYDIDKKTGFIKVLVNKVEEITHNKRDVYNFEVDEDNSYIASGVIVHNCIQSQTAWMKRINIAAMTGAWILDIYSKRNGWIDKLEMKLLAYY